MRYRIGQIDITLELIGESDANSGGIQSHKSWFTIGIRRRNGRKRSVSGALTIEPWLHRHSPNRRTPNQQRRYKNKKNRVQTAHAFSKTGTSP